MARLADTYHPVSRLLHWLVAGLIVVQFVLAELAERAADADQTVRVLGLLANHKSVGMTVLALALARLLWRFASPPPELPPMPAWQVAAARWGHGLLYGLLLAIPLTGWLMSSASSYSVSWFNLFQLPDLIGPSADLKETFENVHELLAKALFVMALIHILAALKHHLVDRDGVLERMASAGNLVLFAAVISGSIYLLADTGGRADSGAPPVAASAAPAAEAAPAEAEANDVAALPVWVIDYDASSIRFVGDQAGAEFEGTWTRWEADIRFAADQLDQARFDVRVDVREVETGDADRDATMQDPDWFDSANHPYVTYRAEAFEAAAEGAFVARGELLVKGLAGPVDLNFTVDETGSARVLTGTGQARLLEGNALLDRLALGLGTGDWEDTTWVGQEVRVEVKVVASVNPAAAAEAARP